MAQAGSQLLQAKLTDDDAECVCPYCNSMSLRCRWSREPTPPYLEPEIRCSACWEDIPVELVTDVIETIPGGER